MVASTTAITPASVAPVRVIPLGPDGSDIDSGTVTADPGTQTRVSDNTLLRSILTEMQEGNRRFQDREDRILIELRAILAAMVDLMGNQFAMTNPEDYREFPSINDQS